VGINPGRYSVAVEAARLLRKNEIVGSQLEAPVTGSNYDRAIRFDFLGEKLVLLPGITTIAQLTGAPILVMLMHRSSDWRHQLLEISPPIPLNGDPITAFKRCLTIVEKAVGENPAYWRFLNLAKLARLGFIEQEKR
jgi:lauroyl/myristoyl acyltransferase